MTTELKRKGGRPKKSAFEKGVTISANVPLWMATWLDKRENRSHEIRYALSKHYAEYVIVNYAIDGHVIEWAKNELSNAIWPSKRYDISDVMTYIKENDNRVKNVPDLILDLAIYITLESPIIEQYGIQCLYGSEDGKELLMCIQLKRDSQLGSTPTEN